jgi:hypothetical protein
VGITVGTHQRWGQQHTYFSHGAHQGDSSTST